MRRVVIILSVVAVVAVACILFLQYPKPVDTKVSGIPDGTKIQIIAAILGEAKRDDHAVTKDGALYVYLPDSLYAGVPKEVNGVQIKQLTIGEYNAGFKDDYIVFTDWKESENTVSVKNIAYFSGGNAGGCTYVFAPVDGKWTEQSRRCFASAS